MDASSHPLPGLRPKVSRRSTIQCMNRIPFSLCTQLLVKLQRTKFVRMIAELDINIPILIVCKKREINSPGPGNFITEVCQYIEDTVPQPHYFQ